MLTTKPFKDQKEQILQKVETLTLENLEESDWGSSDTYVFYIHDDTLLDMLTIYFNEEHGEELKGDYLLSEYWRDDRSFHYFIGMNDHDIYEVTSLMECYHLNRLVCLCMLSEPVHLVG